MPGKLFILSTLLSVWSVQAFACPEGQHSECLAPRPWGGCAQKICVPDLGDVFKGAACSPVGDAGMLAYPGGAEVQLNRNSAGQALHPRFKWALRGHFGDLVDSVRVHYNAKMLDGLNIGPHYINYPSSGQTFGRDIYIEMSEEDVPLSLLAHEMVHTQQWESRGKSLNRFGRDYFTDWCKAGFSYQNNKFEKHARDVEKRFPNDRLRMLPDPVVTLKDMHAGCNAASGAQSNDCHAAIHRYAVHQRLGDAGVAQEVGDNAIMVAALKPVLYGSISMDELKRHHAGCDFPLAQSNDCVAATHRACQARGYGVGLTQEIGEQFFGVACFKADWYGSIAMSELKSLHNGCEFPHARGSHCVAAIRRACEKRGFAAGLAQEVGDQFYVVACFKPAWYGNVRIRP